jgi:RNA polymerase II-associated factor 1
MVVDNSREGQIAAIEKTFQRFMKKADRISPARSMTEDEFLASLKHPTKPGVTAVESLPIFPDFNIWGNSYTLVTFDVDPEISNERSVQSQANEQGVRLFICFFEQRKGTVVVLHWESNFFFLHTLCTTNM